MQEHLWFNAPESPDSSLERKVTEKAEEIYIIAMLEWLAVVVDDGLCLAKALTQSLSKQRVLSTDGLCDQLARPLKIVRLDSILAKERIAS